MMTMALHLLHVVDSVAHPPAGSRKMGTVLMSPQIMMQFRSCIAGKCMYCNVDSVLQPTTCTVPLLTPSNSIFSVVD